MDKIHIPASITLEKGFATKRYKWKSDSKKESIYKRPCKRAVIRFSCKNFAEKINKTIKENRQVLISFLNDSHIRIKKIRKKGISLQGYSGKHPYTQIVVNKCLPQKYWVDLEKINKKSLTFPITVEFDLNEWKEFNLSPDNFLLEVEKDAKSLMRKALKSNFKILKVPKGRSHDLSLINPNKKELIIAISSHVAKTKSRSKEKIVQKILMDISKMLPEVYKNKNIIPIILTRPINFEKSWSFTTTQYLEFYKKNFRFKFLTTEFKNGWENSIIKELKKI